MQEMSLLFAAVSLGAMAVPGTEQAHRTYLLSEGINIPWTYKCQQEFPQRNTHLLFFLKQETCRILQGHCE